MKLVVNDASFLQVYIDTLRWDEDSSLWVYMYIYKFFFLIERKNVSHLNDIIISLYL